jgi:hypothetical protein
MTTTAESVYTRGSGETQRGYVARVRREFKDRYPGVREQRPPQAHKEAGVLAEYTQSRITVDELERRLVALDAAAETHPQG